MQTTDSPAPPRLRYGIQYPDGTFTGLISDQLRAINSYAAEHRGTVYDSHDRQDPVYLAQCAAFGETP